MIATGLMGVGGFGLLGLSILGLLLAFPIYLFQSRSFRRKVHLSATKPSLPSSIDILIPAHNEASHLGATLRSIEQAIQFSNANSVVGHAMTVRVHVGADGCADQTAQVARHFPSVQVTESSQKRTKWLTLKGLVLRSTADWCILVDSGTLWPENFLVQTLRAIQADPQAMAIAPAYEPIRAGFLPRLLWGIERFLKTLEVKCGGPTSVHGASVGYRTDRLKIVFSYLENHVWLNDDVVIPLLMRSLYPQGRIVYPVGTVSDVGAEQGKLDIHRRRRMLFGNLQWARGLLGHCFRLNPVAGFVAVRRLFRVFWAYWIASLFLGLALLFKISMWPIGVGFIALLALSGNFRQMVGAAWVSLLAPLRMARQNWQWEASWK